MGKNQKKNAHKAIKIGSTMSKVARKTSVSDVEGSYTRTAADGSKPTQNENDL
ncbi:MAG: hypothetical protein K0S55_1100 [Clostridia bacterium]|nr:hypothetical protein [Clostridia bacterium]